MINQPINYILRKKLLRIANKVYPSGESIYEYDWDLILILDACRVDLMKDVCDEYDFIRDVNSIRSVNSGTKYWMKETFHENHSEKIANTTYVCGNPYSEFVLDESKFGILDEIWKDGWDDNLGTVPPDVVTDAVIRYGRENKTDRIIGHYMQPHEPFISASEISEPKKLNNFGDFGVRQVQNVWEKMRKEEINKNKMYKAYKDNLRMVLDSIEILLENIDAKKVVISSDHGNSFGTLGIYGHTHDMPIDDIRVVPWIETSAEDKQKHKPGSRGGSDATVEERLKSLGYK